MENLQALRYLDVSNNTLVSLPESVVNLPNLKEVLVPPRARRQKKLRFVKTKKCLRETLRFLTKSGEISQN
jgi:Leucine-rich repeat (LRR) protein